MTGLPRPDPAVLDHLENTTRLRIADLRTKRVARYGEKHYIHLYDIKDDEICHGDDATRCPLWNAYTCPELRRILDATVVFEVFESAAPEDEIIGDDGKRTP